MLKKVSVVVPIYKVEKYLKRCVESILQQTYSNLEIILVDDGSPDHCGKMAEEFADDSRIIVLHKRNGGLSDARNYGMKYVTGEFTMFVDSDDWLETKAVERMVNQSEKYQADIVQSSFYYAYDDYLLYDNRYFSKSDSPIILDNQELIKELLVNEKVKNFAWGKLYKTELIKDIPFKKGVLFEDVFWAHQVMQHVNTYVLDHQPLYYYLQREDSIVGNYSLRNLDIIKGLKERHQFIEENYQELKDESYQTLLKTCMIHYYLLLRNRKQDKKGVNRKNLQKYIQINSNAFKKAVQRDPELRKQLTLFLIHPYCNVFFLLVNKVLRKLNFVERPKILQRINTL